MFEPQEIRSEHKDVIHDVLYDYYGQRIATCSSDQTVKVNLNNISFHTILLILLLFSIKLQIVNCSKKILDLGPKRKGHMDSFRILESTFGLGMAPELGTS